jgi:putative sterol carrier protein
VTSADQGDATAAFFEELAARGHEPLLQKAKGTVSFELDEGKRTQRWVATVDGGAIGVSRKRAAADSIVRTSKELFDGVVRGEVNVMAALMRGAIVVEGDPELVILFQRVFPGPPRQRRPRRRAAVSRR